MTRDLRLLPYCFLKQWFGLFSQSGVFGHGLEFWTVHDPPGITAALCVQFHQTHEREDLQHPRQSGKQIPLTDIWLEEHAGTTINQHHQHHLSIVHSTGAFGLRLGEPPCTHMHVLVEIFDQVQSGAFFWGVFRFWVLVHILSLRRALWFLVIISGPTEHVGVHIWFSVRWLQRTFSTTREKPLVAPREQVGMGPSMLECPCFCCKSQTSLGWRKPQHPLFLQLSFLYSSFPCPEDLFLLCISRTLYLGTCVVV